MEPAQQPVCKSVSVGSRDEAVGIDSTIHPSKKSRTNKSFHHSASEDSEVVLPDQGADSHRRNPFNSKPERVSPVPAKGSRAIHGIFDPEQSLANSRHEFGEHGGVNMSVEHSSTFTVMEPETMSKIFQGQLGPDKDFYLYSRHFNPTVTALSRQLAALEGTESAYCTASGMAAISSALLQLCNAGDHIVASNSLYGGTYALLSEFLPRVAGITATLLDITDLAAVEAALQKPRTRALFFECVANPTLVVADIPALSALARKHCAAVVVDNTFSPVLISPVCHGADIVVHSITKFISGNSDMIAGCVCASEAFVNSMMDLHQGTLMLLGATMNPHVAFQIAGRLPHLGLRMREHSRRALVYAQRLQALGLRVVYPGLPSHPQHRVLARLVNPGYGFGGILGLDVGTLQGANDLMRYLQNCSQFGFMAVSLGFSETLMSCSGASTSSEMGPEEQQKAGISAGYVRISLGYSGQLEQRWAQLYDALVSLNLIPAPSGVAGVKA